MDDDDFNLFSQSNVNSVRIQNNTGENSCYVNVLIHATFYFEELYNSILNFDLTKAQPNMNILIEFQKVLQQYRNIRFDSNDYSLMLDPTAFKIELSELFKKDQIYQLNDQGDPIELFLFLFNAFHSYTLNPMINPIEVKDELCNPPCFIHNLFHLKLIEYNKCAQCDTVTQINYDNNYFIYELYVIEVFKYIKMQQKDLKTINGKLFDYSKISTKQTDVHCEKHTSELLSKSLICKHSSKYLLINLVWNSKSPRVELIDLVFSMIALNIYNQDLFEVKEENQIKKYELSGMLIYWNAHYVCSFGENGKWLLYDDKKIDQFESWEIIIKYLVNNHYQPISLFYTEEKTIISQTQQHPQQKDAIISTKQDQLIPKEVITQLKQNEQKEDTPSIQFNLKNERNRILKDIVPELLTPYKVLEDKPKNRIAKNFKLATSKDIENADDVAKVNLDNNIKKNHYDNSKEEAKHLIIIPKINKNRVIKEKNITESNEVIKCNLCHETFRRNKKTCSCGYESSSNKTKEQLHLNQEINTRSINNNSIKNKDLNKNIGSLSNNQINNNINKKIKIIK